MLYESVLCCFLINKITSAFGQHRHRAWDNHEDTQRKNRSLRVHYREFCIVSMGRSESRVALFLLCFGYVSSRIYVCFGVSLMDSLTLRVVAVDPCLSWPCKEIPIFARALPARRSRLRRSAIFGRSDGAALRAAFGCLTSTDSSISATWPQICSELA